MDSRDGSCERAALRKSINTEYWLQEHPSNAAFEQKSRPPFLPLLTYEAFAVACAKNGPQDNNTKHLLLSCCTGVDVQRPEPEDLAPNQCTYHCPSNPVSLARWSIV
jgi:hypothetical protein